MVNPQKTKDYITSSQIYFQPWQDGTYLCISRLPSQRHLFCVRGGEPGAGGDEYIVPSGFFTLLGDANIWCAGELEENINRSELSCLARLTRQ